MFLEKYGKKLEKIGKKWENIFQKIVPAFKLFVVTFVHKKLFKIESRNNPITESNF